MFAGINRRFSVYPVSVREWKPEFLAVFLRLKGQMMRAKSFTHAVRADARATRERGSARPRQAHRHALRP